MADLEEIKEKLKSRLRPNHYEHSVRTAETAARMARAFDVDEGKAFLAGLLHDYAKSMGKEELVSEATRLGIDPNPVELAEPYLLHGVVGARLVEAELGIADEEIISAIVNHTFGAPAMSKLDKIIYVADMVEPGRPYPGLDELRRMALEDLDEVFGAAYEHTLEFLVRTRQLIHPMTVEVWNNLVSK